MENGKHQLKIGELPDIIDLEMEEQDGVQSCVVPVLSTRVGLWVNLTDDVITWITDSVLAAGAIARVAAPGTFRRRRQADWKKRVRPARGRLQPLSARAVALEELSDDNDVMHEEPVDDEVRCNADRSPSGASGEASRPYTAKRSVLAMLQSG